MKKTFQKDITFLSKILVGTEWIQKPVTKRALFYEFDQSDPDQIEITFAFNDLWDYNPREKSLRARTKQLVPLMDEIIDVMLVVKDPNNPETKDVDSLNIQDVVELKQDNFGMATLAKWFVREKISPFFLSLSMSYMPSEKTQKDL